ncbi:intercellular adhesion molecule 4 isoform X2 [Artibeus jamaicensis]|uniref:intercellular adhesion molecule 4 isoform X2 n=1 Tax=Artibeus jamaicensis TaxID=9417 RepID=UPI00235A91FC|nr:intercellular adhesion molecule 4 isoform X2 [Artibeus jamaicensis]
MGFLLCFSLLVLLAAPYLEGGSAQRHRAVRAQRPRGGSSPMPSETTASFWVSISPKLMTVELGSSVWLNCSSNCPLLESPVLHTGLRRGLTLSGPNWVSFQLLDVRTWSSDVRCFVTCARVTRGATARINTYRPQSVILEPPVLEGREHTLRCHVTHVFPVRFLVVTLRRSGRVIYSESLERFTGLDLANVTLTYAFPAKPNDYGQLVTCHAHLNLDGLVVHGSSAPMALSFLTWSTRSKALASTCIAALVGILLAVGAACLRKYLLMQSRA